MRWNPIFDKCNYKCTLCLFSKSKITIFLRPLDPIEKPMFIKNLLLSYRNVILETILRLLVVGVSGDLAFKTGVRSLWCNAPDTRENMY